MDLVAYMSHVRGKFGDPKEQAWPITVGMNTKGGMDDVDFDDYLSNSLIPLYPDSENIKGRTDGFPGGGATSYQGGLHTALARSHYSLWEAGALKYRLRTATPIPIATIKREARLVNINDAGQLLHWNV